MIANLVDKAQAVLSQNASVILTATGVVGTVGTAVLTGRATFKAAEIIADFEKAENDKTLEDDPEKMIKLDKKAKVVLVWPQYVPPVVLGGGTIAAIVMASRISAKRAAALAAAYAVTESQFEEYKNKALEKLGVNKEKALRDEVAADAVRKNPPSKEVIIIANGDVLFLDQMTGRYFQSTVEKVRKAEAKIHSEIYNYNASSLTIFYDEIGLSPTDFSDLVGWNSENPPSLELSTTMTPDDRPCMTVSLNPLPKPDYEYKPY